MTGTLYTILKVNEIDGPNYPERLELEVSNDNLVPILTYSQDGIGSSIDEIFIDLETLALLGEIAKSLLRGDKEHAREIATESREF